MKKKVLIGVAVTIGVIALTVSLNAKEDIESDMMFQSVEALSRHEGTGNTGPGKIKECDAGGNRKFCMCENSRLCTESDCK